MQLNKYNLGDVVMVQGKIIGITLEPNGSINYKVSFPSDVDDIYSGCCIVDETLISNVF